MDETIIDAGAGAGTTDTTGTVDTTSAATTGAGTTTDTSAVITQPNADGSEATPVDEFAGIDKLFGELKDDEPVAGAVDPNAAAALPEAVTKALAISDYVKEPAHLEAAVMAAQELWDVSSGKVPAANMLEGMRARDPQGFEKLVLNDLIPYLEHITGKKLGGAEAAAADPMAEMQAKLRELEQRPQIEAQQREQQQQQQQAETASRTAVEGFIKVGSGIFDGDTDGALNGILAQLPKLGLTPAALMKEQLAGNTANLEKAYKAAEKTEMLRVKTMTARLVARNKALRNAAPGTKGSPVAAISGDELPLDATREEKVEYMRTGKFVRAAVS